MKLIKKLFVSSLLVALLCAGAGAAYAGETAAATGSSSQETTATLDETVAVTSNSEKAAATTGETATVGSAEATVRSEASQEISADAVADATESEAEISSDEETDSQPLEDGIYIIESGAGEGAELDVEGASSNDGANVQIYESNNTSAQKWELTYGDDGTYTIASEASGKVLDVTAASTEEGTNVQVYSANGTAAQKWVLIKLGGGFYTVVSALDDNMVLDAAAGRSTNGTNVQIWTANGTAAQRWFFARIDSQDPSTRVIADGVYRISSATGADNVLDVSCGSTADGANVQQWSWNGTGAQRWGVAYDEAGYYTIVDMGSGKALDVVGANPGSLTNVWQYAPNGSRAQRWALDDNGDGTFTIRSLISGMVLDVACGSNADGANVQVYRPNGTKAQKWTFTAVDALTDGLYQIYTMLDPGSKLLQVSDANGTSGAVLELATDSAAQTQKFSVSRNSDGTYAIKSIVGGLSLTLDGSTTGSSIVQSAWTGAENQKWNALYDKGGIRLISIANPELVIAVAGGQANAGASIIGAVDGAQQAAYRWLFAATSLINEGYYIVQNVGSGKVLDIVAGKMASGANLQQYDANGSGAQVFHFIKQGNYYQIENSRSYKSLDVEGASTSDGANVRQWDWNGTNAQLWRAELDDDFDIVLINVASGKALDVSGGSHSNGANVQQYAKNGTKAQAWKLTLTNKYSLTGDEAIDRYLASVVGANNDDFYSCFLWQDAALAHVQSVEDGEYHGICGDDVTLHFVAAARDLGVADCYVDAALCNWFARACGYSANMIGGYCPRTGGGWATHGWTEVYVNGVTYVCDANLNRDYPGYGWFMTTYENAPVEYLLQ